MTAAGVARHGSGRWIALAAFAAFAVAPRASAQTTRLAHDVQPGSLDQVLPRIASEGGYQIVFDPTPLAARRLASPLPHGLPLAEAFARALRGSGLRAREAAPGVLVIEAVPADAAPAPLDSDIVVTALRRPTLLGRTAMGISAVPGATLRERRIYDNRTLRRQLPDLVQVSTGPLQRRLALRGVSGTGESTVGTYYGETPVSGPSGTGFDAGAIAPDIDLIDVERVELLRGPQGTLYGAGSMGGTLRTLFNRADPSRLSGEASVEASITAHGEPGAALDLVANLPLVREVLAVRAVVGRRREGGVIDNGRLGIRDTDDRRRESERVSLAWSPRDDLRLDATWLSQRNRIGDAGTAYLGDGRLKADQAVRVPSRERLTLGSATLHWTPPGVRVVATASHYDWQIVKQLDFTRVIDAQRGSTAACLRYAATIGAPGCDDATRAAYAGYLDTRLPAALYQPMSVRSTSGEVRVSDAGNGVSGWTVGMFLEHREDDVDSYAVRVDRPTGLVVMPLDVTGLRTIATMLDQQAVFAEVRHGLGAGITAAIGGRLYRYVRHAGGATPIPNLFTGTGAIERGDYRSHETGGNLKAELGWTPREDVFVYAVAAEGFRPGGVNITPELSDAERAYHADHLWSLELGTKAPRLFGHFGIEASVYRIDWDDTIFATNSANGAFIYNTNLSSVLIHGGEAQLTWTERRWRVALSASVVDARLAADTLLGTSDGVGHEGDRLPNIPTLTYAALWDWTILDHRDGTTLALGGGVTGNGASESTFNSDSAYREHNPARVLADLYLTARRGRWTARVGADNLFDALAPGRITSSGFALHQVYVARPRTITLGMTRRF